MIDQEIILKIYENERKLVLLTSYLSPLYQKTILETVTNILSDYSIVNYGDAFDVHTRQSTN